MLVLSGFHRTGRTDQFQEGRGRCWECDIRSVELTFLDVEKLTLSDEGYQPLGTGCHWRWLTRNLKGKRNGFRSFSGNGWW